MTSTRRTVNNQQGSQEIESVKESINDIINQLQDIDPSRLSFSPFLDLDTQISLAPVSDSPESSVEELHSPTHSIPGSQLCLQTQAAEDHNGPTYFNEHQKPYNHVEETTDDPITMNLAPVYPAESTPERFHIQPPPHGPNGLPSGGDEPWSPSGSNQLESTIGESHPLIQSPPEAIELGLWTAPDQDHCDGGLALSEHKSGCCCCSRCCKSGRVPALCSTVACLLCLPGILYALYLYAPVEAPLCPDTTSRLVFTLSCCAVAAVPILIAMLTAGVCRFCSGSLRPVVEKPNSAALVQVFVVGSVVQLFLYILNLLILATFLPQNQLRMIPILAGVFIGGRIIYWLLLHTCSSWRAFGSGLTIFPLLAVFAFNIYCLFDLSSRDLFFGSQDVYANDTRPSAWPQNISMSLGDT
ncbi:hypothetical protein AALO_G00125310 [Alosa alosa]|uniref:Uncharacterized protein n=1 Tax=Alosa alosa TaxID=278164 RepID=A0AAV6GQN5_9TELE|nr:transmembrane protein 79-like [Alosa alosa]KAG5275856.1 hypothetical protein AALO_G00125310 [Alosa alosa]